ncbi:MAG: ImmA/IrrE family metallo-endopeptidase [Phycisphaerales bacterium]|jgi:Zn-dependent peptidase ImmA (M78 family)|nr:ImmA/IrrE family metallo-endopeptidase [Phycisphaerales bacterium]
MAIEGIDIAVKAADKLRRQWNAGNRPGHVLFELADKNSVLVFRLALAAKLSGLFVRSTRDKMSLILVNTTNNNIYRQRFTLAHELGHHQLHQDRDIIIDMDGQRADDPREHEANVFAAQLLVPLKELTQVLSAYSVTATDVTDRLIVELAKLFGVSHETILWRIKIIGKLPQKDIQHRIDDTDWDAAWQRFAPDAHANTLCAQQPPVWHPQGVSSETARQVSGLPGVYREMAFEAYQRRKITAGKLAEILGLSGSSVVLDELAPLITLDQANDTDSPVEPEGE